MLTRKDLRDMGITDEEQITAIINRHKGEIEDLKEAHKAAKPVEPKPAETTPAEKKPAPKGDALDELEKLRRELEAEKQKAADRERKDVIMTALAAHNPRNAAVLYSHLDKDKVVIEGGKVKSGLEEQVTPLRESDTYLFADAPDERGGADPAGGSATPATTSATMNQLIRGGL